MRIFVLLLIAFVSFSCVTRMPDDTIRKTLQSYMNSFKTCYSKYDDFPSGNPSQGEVTINFTVSGPGDVIKAGIEEGSTVKEEVQECVVHVLRDIKFTPVNSGNPVTIRQKIKFSAK